MLSVKITLTFVYCVFGLFFGKWIPLNYECREVKRESITITCTCAYKKPTLDHFFSVVWKVATSVKGPHLHLHWWVIMERDVNDLRDAIHDYHMSIIDMISIFHQCYHQYRLMSIPLHTILFISLRQLNPTEWDTLRLQSYIFVVCHRCFILSFQFFMDLSLIFLLMTSYNCLLLLVVLFKNADKLESKRTPVKSTQFHPCSLNRWNHLLCSFWSWALI